MPTTIDHTDVQNEHMDSLTAWSLGVRAQRTASPNRKKLEHGLHLMKFYGVARSNMEFLYATFQKDFRMISVETLQMLRRTNVFSILSFMDHSNFSSSTQRNQTPKPPKGSLDPHSQGFGPQTCSSLRVYEPPKPLTFFPFPILAALNASPSVVHVSSDSFRRFSSACHPANGTL